MKVFSWYQVRGLEKFRGRVGERVEVVCDLGLGLRREDAAVGSGGLCFDDGSCLNWDAIKKINKNDNACYTLVGDEIEKIQAFSEMTGRVYTLYPTVSAPTMLVSGLPMHRIKNTNPYLDALAKANGTAPIVGRVLDTATGLGYTAIEAARLAEQVVTVELDPAAQEIIAANPWSQELRMLGNIEQRIGDSFDEVQGFEDGSFERIIHDPPVFGLAGHLYSAEFYTHLHRILVSKGRLFHYIGNPESPSGARTTRGVIARLKGVGFSRVTRYPQAFGVVAVK